MSNSDREPHTEGLTKDHRVGSAWLSGRLTRRRSAMSALCQEQKLANRQKADLPRRRAAGPHNALRVAL
jgi:hypothetical protein